MREHARSIGHDLDRGLVGLERGDRLVHAHGRAIRLEPLDERGLRDRLGEARHLHLEAHVVPSLVASCLVAPSRVVLSRVAPSPAPPSLRISANATLTPFEPFAGPVPCPSAASTSAASCCWCVA